MVQDKVTNSYINYKKLERGEMPISIKDYIFLIKTILYNKRVKF